MAPTAFLPPGPPRLLSNPEPGSFPFQNLRFTKGSEKPVTPKEKKPGVHVTGLCAAGVPGEPGGWVLFFVRRARGVCFRPARTERGGRIGEGLGGWQAGVGGPSRRPGGN